ncbi:MAG: thiamine-phosphate kinase [Planctomycetaceae bacterium]
MRRVFLLRNEGVLCLALMNFAFDRTAAATAWRRLICERDSSSSHSSANASRTIVGIGDDAAVLTNGMSNGAGELLVTVDMLMEGVHFNDPPASPTEIGRKSLAVNLSDIAAMGGVPTEAFVSIALPRSRGSEWSIEFLDGIAGLAREFDVRIAGGDTNIWNGPLVVSITMHGRTQSPAAILRSGAKPGDWLMVTGQLGGSLSGRHLNFTPRVKEAQHLMQRVVLHSMLDLSDGLSTDLPRLAVASQVGFVVEARSIPIHADVDPRLPPEIRLAHAMSDGEDFELLFCVTPADGARLLSDPTCAPWLSHIGEATAESGVMHLRHPDGRLSPWQRTGYEHRFVDDVAEGA